MKLDYFALSLVLDEWAESAAGSFSVMGREWRRGRYAFRIERGGNGCPMMAIKVVVPPLRYEVSTGNFPVAPLSLTVEKLNKFTSNVEACLSSGDPFHYVKYNMQALKGELYDYSRQF